MNPESGSLMRVVAHSVLTSGFSTQRPASGFKLTKNNVASRKGDYPGTAAENVPVIWS